MNQRQAGWYPDPERPDRMRYWSGSEWTDQVSPPELPEEPEVPDTPQQLVEPQPEVPLPPPPAEPEVPPPPFSATEQQWGQPGPTNPAAGSAVPVAAGEKLGPDGQVLADFSRRAGGWLLDWLIVTAVAGFLALIVVAATVGFDGIVDRQAWSELLAKVEADPGYQPSNQEVEALVGPGLGAAVLWTVGLWLLCSFFNGVLVLSSSGQTVGDRMVRIRKVRRGRRVPGLGSALLRWLIPIVLLLLAPFTCLLSLLLWGACHLWPVWDSLRRTWQDAAAGTVVERADLIGPPSR
jgi:uncharacterized RDD family membrane protein YckC